jgi:allophanate hydrolase subunit 2
MFTTIQDLGRMGYQRFGVAVSGAMDPLALRAANRLVGNVDGEAGIEITLAGPELRFEGAARIAVTGADLAPRLDGRPMQMWRAVPVRRGAVLSFDGRRSGMRAYVAIDGGIAVPLVLGSRSTSTRPGIGGLDGRALHAGDVLPLGALRTQATQERGDPRADSTLRSVGDDTPWERQAFPGLSTDPAAVRRDMPWDRQAPRHEPSRRPAWHEPSRRPAWHDSPGGVVVRVVMGPQDDAFTDAGRETFLHGAYAMTSQSDRIGCRFDGPRIEHRSSADIVSDGTTVGAVQVAGDGMPLVLMADRGTTGGYTKIATVISADIGLIAQAAPGDRVRFVAVTLSEAWAAAREQDDELNALVRAALAAPAVAGDEVYDEDAGGAWAADASAEFAEAIKQTGWERKS